MQLNQLPIVTKPSDGRLTAAEREQILVMWNNTADYPIPDRCIHEYIEEQVLKTPDAIALISTDENGEIHQLTYSELNSKSNQLAHYLYHRLQLSEISSETTKTTPIVAVCVERSAEMVIAFLAILKAGAAHLSLDPLEPVQRRVYKLVDSNAILLLTQDSMFDSVVPENVAIGVLCLDRDWPTISLAPSIGPTENLPCA